MPEQTEILSKKISVCSGISVFPYSLFTGPINWPAAILQADFPAGGVSGNQ